MNKILTVNGDLAIGAYGEAHQETPAGAPNLKLGATITLFPEAIQGLRSGSITMAAALPAGILAAAVVWYGRDALGARRAFRWPAPDDLLVAMKGGAGPHLFEAEVGPLGGGVLERCALVLRNAVGWGRARDIERFAESAEPAAPLVITAAPTLDVPTEGEELTGAGPIFTGGGDNVAWVWVYQVGPSTTGPWTDIADTEGTCPSIAGGNDCLRRGAKFTGDGVPGGELISWSAGREITPSSETVEVTLERAAIIASQKIVIDGITASGFDPGETVTAGSATATLVKFVPDAGGTTGTLYTGPITGGPIPDDTAIWCAGGAATTNGASADYPMTAGEPFYVLPATFTGNPTRNDTIQSASPDGTDETAEEVEWSGVVPAAYVNFQFMHTQRVSGFGIDGYEDFSTAWTPIVAPVLAPLAPADWLFKVTQNSDGTTTLDEIYIRDALNPEAAWWFTGQDSYMDAAVWPTGREATTRGGTITIEGVVYRRFACAPAIGADGKNYQIFGATEDGRRSRLGAVAQINGFRTPRSARKTVPGSITPTTTRFWERFFMRVWGQAAIGEDGGTGMQFPRAFDFVGDFGALGFDITYMMYTGDFGENYESARDVGQFANETYTGVIIDGDLIHVQGGVASLEQVGNYATKTGAYRINRATKQAEFIQFFDKVYGSNMSPTRRNLRYITLVPGSGSGPTTRTLYQIHAPAAYSSKEAGFSAAQLYKANANGGSAYAAEGSAMPKATYGIPLGIRADSAGVLYYWGTKGGFRRHTDGTWKKFSMPASAGTDTDCAWVEIHGTKVYAGVRGKGIYIADTSSNLSGAGVLTFERLGPAYDLFFFSVCPTNTNRIVRCGKAQVKPQWTHTGGAAAADWENIDTQKFPGQFNDFEHYIHGEQAWFRWHDTDPNLLVAMRFHHMGKSYDGGRTFVWSSRGFDYSGLKSIAFGSTYRMIFAACTDRLMMYSDNAGNFVVDDNVNSHKPAIFSAIGASGTPALTARGGLILENGQHIATVAHIGAATGISTPVISTRVIGATKAGTGNGGIEVSATGNFPSGIYKFACTAAASNGGTFAGTTPSGDSMGNWTVGTERTWNDPGGNGSITVKISDGSTDFATNAVFTVCVGFDLTSGGTGNGAIEVSVSPNLPSGMYTLTCSTAAANGGTFGGVGPNGEALGNWTVGTERTYTHPWGGTLKVKINDGSTDFAVGKTFSIYVNPIGSHQVLNPATKSRGDIGATNPVNRSRGGSGRHFFQLSSAGNVTILRTAARDILGYGGLGGSVVFGYSGDSIYRSTDEGQNYGSAWYSGGSGNDHDWSGLGVRVGCTSVFDDQRVYIGVRTGRVKKIQNGSATVIFDFDEVMDYLGIGTTGVNAFPGTADVGGRRVSMIIGVAESFFDANLVFCTVHVAGGPYQNWRCKNALGPKAYPKAAGNIGTGTVGSLTATSAVVYGEYKVEFTSATAFTVKKPDGSALGTGTVGTAFSAGGLGFTISAGVTPFVSGSDSFTIHAKPFWENVTLDGLTGPQSSAAINPHTDEFCCLGRHGTTFLRAEASHRTAKGITASLCDEFAARRTNRSLGV